MSDIRRGLITVIVWTMLCGTALAQAVEGANITLRETLGIRRTEFPVSVRVPLPKGAVSDLTQLRLRGPGGRGSPGSPGTPGSDDAEVAAQFTTDERWGDGSTQWLAVDFNVSMNAGETRVLRLEYGKSITAESRPRGLTVSEEGDAVQVGSVKFGKSGWPLLASVTYRGEIIGPGRNGLTVVDVNGVAHDFGSATAVSIEVLKRGPLSVLIRYRGRIPIDGTDDVAVVLLCEMPNSKSWVKFSASIADPARRVRRVVLETPFALGAQPWTWDFGTDTGTYGVLRNPGDAAVLTQQVAPGARNWQVETVTPKDRRIYETSVPGRATTASGWGHLLDAQNAIAFAIDRFARDAGTYTVSLNGAGQSSIGFAPAQPAATHRLTVYQHYVGTPVAIGAATPAAAMVTPLAVSVDRDQYIRSGQPPPVGAPREPRLAR
jgi:hypothetical protein